MDLPDDMKSEIIKYMSINEIIGAKDIFDNQFLLREIEKLDPEFSLAPLYRYKIASKEYTKYIVDLEKNIGPLFMVGKIINMYGYDIYDDEKRIYIHADYKPIDEQSMSILNIGTFTTISECKECDKKITIWKFDNQSEFKMIKQLLHDTKYSNFDSWYIHKYDDELPSIDEV